MCRCVLASLNESPYLPVPRPQNRYEKSKVVASVATDQGQDQLHRLGPLVGRDRRDDLGLLVAVLWAGDREVRVTVRVQGGQGRTYGAGVCVQNRYLAQAAWQCKFMLWVCRCRACRAYPADARAAAPAR